MTQENSLQVDYSKCRQNVTYSDKVVCIDGNWQVLRKTRKYGLDPDFKKFVHYKTVESYLPIKTQGLMKEILQPLYVKKTALNEDTMQTVSKWFKLVRKISVIDPDSNIFLTEADGRIFQTDLTTTCPLEFNYTPSYLKIETIKEYPLGENELKALNDILFNDKIQIKPLLAERLQTGEIRLII